MRAGSLTISPLASPKTASQRIVLYKIVPWFFILVSLIVFGSCYLFHTLRLVHLRNELSHSTLVYKGAASLTWMPQHFGAFIGTGIDCNQTQSSLCSTAAGPLPELIMPSGTRTGRGEITGLVDEVSYRTEGASALFIIAFGAVSAFLLRNKLAGWFGWLALLTAFVGWCFPLRCATCAFGGGWSNYAPLGAAVLGFGLLTLSMVPWRNAALSVTWVACAGVAIVQGLLIAQYPKLCPLCLSISVLTQLLGQSALASKGSLIVAVPRQIAIIGVVLCIVFTTRSGLITYGALPDGYKKGREEATLLGQRIDSWAQASHVRRQIVLVTRNGCEACESAERSMNSGRISYVHLPTCTLGLEGQCFDAHTSSFGVPMLLAVDGDGVVRGVTSGWPSSPSEQRDLVNKLNHLASK